MKLSGTVFSSRGAGKNFLELPWVKQQITENLGFAPYPGTLNVKLSEESAKRRKLLEKPIRQKSTLPTAIATENSSKHSLALWSAPL
jgi:CTP-dependent riboflavin kinase